MAYTISYEVPDDFHVISLHHYSHLGFSAHLWYCGKSVYYGTNRSNEAYAPTAQEAIDRAIARIKAFIAEDAVRPRTPIIPMRAPIDPKAIAGVDFGSLDL